MPPTRWRDLFELAARPFRGKAAVDREIDTHLELVTDELERRGWTREAAAAEARRRFGDVGSYRRVIMTIDARQQRGSARRQWWSDLGQDLGMVGRGLIRTPLFTVGVIVTLALGIGVNATMIGLVDRLLFKPPAHLIDPDRLVRYTLTQTHPTFGSFTNASVTYRELALQRESSALADLAGFYSTGLSYGRGEAARELRATLATANFFSMLGVRPEIGRFFGDPDDPIGGGDPTVVISHRLWQREFANAPDVVGKSLWLGSRQYQIIGVAPKYFTGVDLDAVDAWLPMHTGAREFIGSSDEWRDTWNWQWVKLLGRLAPGATRVQAGAEATTRYRAATADDEERKNDRGVVTFQPLVGGDADQSKTPIVVALLAGVSVLVLLITCANVANLVLARGLARRRETAVRVALGVGRGRLVRGLLIESLALAAVSAGVGLLLAYGGGIVVRAILLPGIDFIEPPVDGRLLAAAFLASLVTGVLVGLVPALQLSRPDLTEELRGSGAGRGSAGREHVRLRNGLLLTQAALSVIMLLCAGLFWKSLRSAESVDFGFRPEGLVTADIDLAVAGYTIEQRHAFYDDAYRRFQAVAGVRGVSLTTTNPFWTRQGTAVRIPGRDSIPRLKTGGPYFSAVTPEYFTTLGIAIIRGRPFTADDHAGGARVLVVNETLARTFWPGEEAIGKCLYIGRDADICRLVVGVSADASNESLERQAVQAYYLPLAQNDSLSRDRYLMIRAADDPAAMLGTARRVLQTMAPNLPVASARLMQEQIEPLMRPWRLGAALFGIMGLVALTVALVGLYSVLSYLVAQRTREFGIRSALGARLGDVVRMVVVEGQRTIVVGIVVGLGLAVVGIKFLVPPALVAKVLYQTSPTDPWILGGVAVLLVVTTLLGSLLPAFRASRVPPMEALRAD
ncbi:MAG: ABC transporter permease [Gemmatimonadales bacterium]